MNSAQSHDGSFGEAPASWAGEEVALEATRGVASQIEGACTDWLATLTTEQRQKANFAPPGESEDERLRWFFTPTDHGGLPLGEQRPHQQRRAMGILACALSEAGYVTVTTLMGLENVLDRLEGFARDLGRDRGRDPAMYYLSVFGTPGDTLWGWRFGGHHVSISQLISEGRVVSTTPFFLGADPASAPLLGSTLRPLAGVQDVALAFAESLDDQQFSQAQIHTKAVPEIVGGNRSRLRDGDQRMSVPGLFRELPPDPADVEALKRLEITMQTTSGYAAEDDARVALTSTPAGLSTSSLTEAQSASFSALLDLYFSRVPESVADVFRQRYARSENLDRVCFAWAGDRRSEEPHYYRIQGPGILIEYDNTQRDANHVHSVWRDPRGDFGMDLLGSHHASHSHD